MTAPVLIFAVGNESRGDDALGPLLLRQLDEWLKTDYLDENRNDTTTRQTHSPLPIPLPLAGEGANDTLRELSIDRFELIEDFQLQIEHAMDMKGRQQVLFIDAGMDTPSPYAFYRAIDNDEQVLYSHALSPEALLKVYTKFYQEAPPDAYVLCISGASFELGEPPSPHALDNLADALQFAKQLLSNPDIWAGLCTRTCATIRSAQAPNQLTH